MLIDVFRADCVQHHGNMHGLGGEGPPRLGQEGGCYRRLPSLEDVVVATSKALISKSDLVYCAVHLRGCVPLEGIPHEPTSASPRIFWPRRAVRWQSRERPRQMRKFPTISVGYRGSTLGDSALCRRVMLGMRPSPIGRLSRGAARPTQHDGFWA